MLSKLASVCHHACRECLLAGQKDRKESTNGCRYHAEAENLALGSQERKEAHHGALDKSWVSSIPCANSSTRLFDVTVIFPA